MAKQVRNPNRFDHLRGEVRWGRCEICGLEYPESQITTQEGKAVCVDDYEAQGFDLGRQRLRNEGTSVAAAITAKHKTPKFTTGDGITQGGSGVTLAVVTDVGELDFNRYAVGERRLNISALGTTSCDAYGENLTLAKISSITTSSALVTASNITVPSSTLMQFDLTDAGATAGDYDLIITYVAFGASNRFKNKVRVL